MSRRKDKGGGAGAGGSHAGRDTIFAFTACTMRDKQLEVRRSTWRGGEGQKQIQQRKNKKQKQTHKIKCRERSCKEEAAAAAARNNVI